MNTYQLRRPDNSIATTVIASSMPPAVAPNKGVWELVPPVVPTLADTITAKLADLAAYRYSRETGGITVGGATVPTTRDSQALITGAYTALKNGVTSQVNYKAAGGIWLTLTAAQFYPVAEAVFGHVQACFDNERAHSQAIQALTSGATVQAYDFTTGWPA